MRRIIVIFSSLMVVFLMGTASYVVHMVFVNKESLSLGVFSPYVYGALVDVGDDYHWDVEASVLRWDEDGLFYDIEHVAIDNRVLGLAVDIPRVRVALGWPRWLGGEGVVRRLAVGSTQVFLKMHEEGSFLEAMVVRLLTWSKGGGEGVLLLLSDMFSAPLDFFVLEDSQMIIENHTGSKRFRLELDTVSFETKAKEGLSGDIALRMYAERCGGRDMDEGPRGSAAFSYHVWDDVAPSRRRYFALQLSSFTLAQLAPCLEQGETSVLSSLSVDEVEGTVEGFVDDMSNIPQLSFKLAGKMRDIQAPRFYTIGEGHSSPGIESFHLHIDMNFVARAMRVRDVRFRLAGGGVVSLFSHISDVHGTETYHVPMVLSFESLDLRVVSALWPKNLSTSARAWVLKRLRQGTIDYAQMHMDVMFSPSSPDPYRLESFQGDMFFRETHFLSLDDASLLVRGDGVAYYDETRFDIDIVRGMIHDVAIGGSTMRFIDLDKVGMERAEMDIHITSDLEDFFYVMDTYSLYGDFPLVVERDRFGGFVNAICFLRYVLRDDPQEETHVAFAGDILHFWVKDAFAGYDLSSPAVQFTLDDDSLYVEGSVEIGGGVAKGVASYETFFSQESTYVRRERFMGWYHADQHVFEGIRVDGSLFVDDRTLHRRDGSEERRIKIDGRHSAVRFPVFFWEKERGTEAFAEVTMQFDADGVLVVAPITIGGEGIDVRGTARLVKSGESYSVVSLDFPVMRLGMSDVALQWDDMGQVRTLTIEGDDVILSSLADVMSFYRETFASGTEKEGTDKDVAMSLALGRLRFAEGATPALTDVALSFVTRDTLWRRFTWTAETRHGDGWGDGRAARHEVSLSGGEDDASDRNLQMLSEDVGAFLHAFTGYDGIDKGRIDISGFFLDSAPESSRLFDGTFLVDDMVIKDSLLVTRLSNMLSPSGIVKFFTGDGSILFEEGDGVIFVERGSDKAHLQGGVLWGDTLGMTVDGFYELSGDRLSLEGVFVPSYVLNNFLGKIPVIGDFGGGDESHFVGVPYTLDSVGGQYDFDITLGSSLAPPLLRRFLDVF
ncbi:MAG: hypothetical protein GDA54_03100 [Alphaproteobacteria bacterium GM7ARS4]|nr:hypothetical protein [Alphaproteobacteria bacterium GM7ARS4]